MFQSDHTSTRAVYIHIKSEFQNTGCAKTMRGYKSSKMLKVLILKITLLTRSS